MKYVLIAAMLLQFSTGCVTTNKSIKNKSDRNFSRPEFQRPNNRVVEAINYR